MAQYSRHTGPQPGPATREDKPRPGDGGARFLCHLNRHEPFARQANWTGEYYVSRCEHCGVPIRRERSGKWVKDLRAAEFL